MNCDRFAEFERQYAELKDRYSNKDNDFCGKWFFEVVYHIRYLRSRFARSHGKTYQLRISNEDCEFVQDNTTSIIVEPLARLLLDGFHNALMRELRDLEGVVAHMGRAKDPTTPPTSSP